MLLNQTIDERQHKRNFLLLLWHSFFFLLTINVLDKDTVLPSLLSRMGAGEFLIGLLSVITIGLPKFSQILFGQFFYGKAVRKPYLIKGFLIRVISLLALGYVLWEFYLFELKTEFTMFLVFVLFTIYSFAAAFTSVAIVDIAPRSLFYTRLKKFYTLKQIGNSIGMFLAVFIVRKVLRSYPYPLNYSLLHFLAGGILFIGTLALFYLSEKVIITRRRFNFFGYLRYVAQELRKNSSLLNFALIVNMEGLFLSIIPFFTTLAISKFSLNVNLIGILFEWKIFGVLFSSFLLFLMKDYDYFKVLGVNLGIAIFLPVVLLLFSENVWFYELAFFLVGVFNSFYRITYEGILVEISNEKNRAAYASVLGSSNVSTFIIPLISGSLIQLFGYELTFVLSSILMGFSILFFVRLRRSVGN